MTPIKIALISTDASDLEFTKELAQICNGEMLQEAQLNATQVKSKIAQGFSYFIDVATTGSVEQIAALGLTQFELNRVHFICPPIEKTSDNLPENRAHLLKAFDSAVVQNIIFRRYGSPAMAAEAYSHILKSSYLATSFGLQSFFGDDVQVDGIQFKEALERGFVSQALTHQLTQLGYNELIIPAVITAVDELLMNAIFDAPVDENGKQIYARQSRNTNLKLEGKHAVEMQVGGKGDLIGVNVVDCYGSLDSVQVKQHIAKSFNGKQDEVRDATLAGAGLGLSLVLKRGGSLLYVYKPGARTDATVFFRRTDRLKEFNRQFQFVCMRLSE